VMVAALIATPVVFAEEKSDAQGFSLDVGVPGGFGPNVPNGVNAQNALNTVGGRIFVDDELVVEAMAALQINGEDKDAGIASGTLISATGGIMKYLSKGRVSPYLRAGGGVVILSGDAYKNQDSRVMAYAGVGAEFSITDQISIRSSVNGVLTTGPFTLSTATSDLILSFMF